ncbi:signal transduction histidine kinase/ActR/RegA family two-component response regulator [Caulobacter rhizosphaerae]|uniref:histidine kinase n=1 Tax=Caulobacter rhizosphaerae TaxID=2010972 RepID=A0ABU1MVD3_9CAUL|nr:ATP-binding protein [Caulobacter rhizosphaerae]MDR6530148.1 signal transduction histidine kinase/ActR/RegA family two-component response regulator [Caulobacter rhizosphaerae]
MKQAIGKPEPIPTREIVGPCVPILRGYLLAAATYYSLISVAHPFYERGVALLVLESLALATAATGFWLWRRLKARPPEMPGLETAALAINALFMANVVAYQILHFEPAKLVYFVLMALAFATSAPTWRVALASVGAAIIGLLAMARNAPGDLVGQYGFIGVAGAFAALGMSALMRGAMMRELRARLASDALNRKLEAELEENRRLRTEAQDLAVAAETASRAKTEFLETMSHEIRTPLNGVLGMAQAMERDTLSARQRARLALIGQSGAALLAVINAVLDISRIEAGKMEVVRAPFDLDALADTLRQLYGGLARDKGLDFTLEIAPRAGGWRDGDAARLRQVMSNLISNAIKFTDAGGVVVLLGGDAATLTCAVTDTGMGVPETRRAQIFDKFVQVDGSSTRRSGGSGLGLAICRELVTLMGGEIGFESPAGGGARFTFAVPCPALGSLVQPASVEAAGAAPALDGALKMLVVDDNAVNRTVLQAMLGHLGVACDVACDGHEAVALWETGSWDAILMDIHMPGMDGLEAGRVIRARESAEGRARTPILAVTASVLAHETDRYLAAGMDGFVAKPIAAQRLAAALDAALSGAS